jgi:hypothetical protein
VPYLLDLNAEFSTLNAEFASIAGADSRRESIFRDADCPRLNRARFFAGLFFAEFGGARVRREFPLSEPTENALRDTGT